MSAGDSGEGRGEGIRGLAVRISRSPVTWLVILALGLAAGYALGGRTADPAGDGSVRATAERTSGAGAGAEPVGTESFSSRVGAGPVERESAVGTAAAGGDVAEGRRAAASPQEASSPRYTPTVAAAREVSPSVVSVTVLRRERRAAGGLFDFFVPFGYERTVEGLGSGFAIDDRGHILTNEHVVRGAIEIVVADARGQTYRAELVGTDELTDIALLQITAGRVPPAPLASSSDLMVGEPAVAIGNPYGYVLANSEATVTSGVVSGVGRDIRPSRGQEALYADMIQTDAPINPGNSGGPLVNANGRVIGVNTSIIAPGEESGSVGLGFAIPIDRALRIADELRSHGRIRRPWVGVELEARTDDRGRPLTVVRRVTDGSPAGRAGLSGGDVVHSLNGEPVRSPLDWEVSLLEAGVGATARVRYERGGGVDTVEMEILELPSQRADRIRVLEGLELVTVTPEIADERSLRVEEGALIVGVDREVSYRTGLESGDVVVAVNRSRIRSAEQAAELFRYYAGRGQILVRAYRGGTLFTTSFFIRG